MTDQGRLPPSSIAPFALRLQPSVKAALEKEAARNGRSLNAEIADRLEKSIAAESTVETRLASLERDVDLLRGFVFGPALPSEGTGLAKRLAMQRLKKLMIEIGLTESQLPLSSLDDKASFEDAAKRAAEQLPTARRSEALAQLKQFLESLPE